MKMMIVHGFAAAALGATLAIGFGTQAQAAAPANYSRACTEISGSNTVMENFVQKAVTAAGVAHRSARRTARRTARRHGY